MRVTPLGCQVPSSMVAGGPAASTRPPYFATMGPATFKYSWNPVGSVTSMSTTTYAAMSRLLLPSASPVDEPAAALGEGAGGHSVTSSTLPPCVARVVEVHHAPESRHHLLQ